MVGASLFKKKDTYFQEQQVHFHLRKLFTADKNVFNVFTFSFYQKTLQICLLKDPDLISRTCCLGRLMWVWCYLFAFLIELLQH